MQGNSISHEGVFTILTHIDVFGRFGLIWPGPDRANIFKLFVFYI